MHSKLKIWDFFKSGPKLISNDGAGIIALYCYDPMAFNLLKETIDYSLFSEEKLNVKVGQELTTTWFDDNFKTLGLFGNSDSFLVHNANELDSDIKDQVLNPAELLLDNRFFLLNFAKDDAFFKKLEKSESEHIQTIRIQAPAFWEDSDLINFLCMHLNVYLAEDAKQLIKEAIPFELSAYYHALSQIKLSHPEGMNLRVADIQDLIQTSRIDTFGLAELFSGKKMNQFYRKLDELVENDNDVIQFFYFLHSHLIKLYDPSYLAKKSKLSKYDKRIQQHAQLWDKEQISKAIQYIGELLTLTKSKDDFLSVKIRRDLNRTIRI